jgi:hypothetical protein
MVVWARRNAEDGRAEDPYKQALKTATQRAGRKQHPESWCGVPPRPGELVWLTKSASLVYTERPAWFRVLDVKPSTIPGWVYLHGYEADEEHRQLRTVFCCVGGLVVRRE